MEAPPRDRFRTTGAGPRSYEGTAEVPLHTVLFAVVIALAAVLVALMLYPLFRALDMGTTGLNDRLESAGAAFTRIPHPPERSTIYAADGSVLATLYLDENRQIVRLRMVAPIARDAVLAIEDDGFYGHGPINVPSVFRAVLANLIAGRITQGGSTITQQLAKNAVISTNEQTFARKFQEAALAMRLEQRYSKDKILEMYLNEVYFGNGVYGIGTASQHYFGKPASKLNLPQGALLAGLIAAPEQYNPVTHPQRAEARRNEVLGRLATLGWVPQADIDRAMASPIRLAETAGETGQTVQPFFIHYITQSILDNEDGEFDAFGKTYNQRRHTLFQGGLKIYTTLKPDWQRYAQEAVDASSAIDPKRGPDVSLVSVDAKTGAIRAMLSGKDYPRDQLDLVWQGRRQVGSAFKPFTLVAAFQEEFPPGKVYSSKSPFCSSLWLSETGCVSNAEGAGDRGYIDLWTATQNSVNVVFAQLALDVGAEQIVKAAQQMGISSPLTAVPSITLGTVEVSTLDMAAAFSTLANDGVRCQAFAVVRVVLPGGEKLFQHKPECRQVIDPDIAHLVTAMLQRVVCCGTGSAAQIGRPMAGKTGTAQDYTNVYFAGYTPQVATAVWVGIPEGQVPMDSYYGHSVFGGTVAAPIWHDFMVKAMSGMPVLAFPAPPPQPGGEIPNVVGLRSGEAQEILVEANFTPIVEKVDSSVLVNTVLEQSPKGGTTATLGSGVKLTVSNGKRDKGHEDGQPVLVPNVVGLAEKDAVDALKAAGLEADEQRIEVSDPDQDGIVQIQSPAAHQQVPAGSTVTIWVGQRAQGPGRARSP
ncbi:MAG: transglycosylase domain-containing protein [Actinomycetota bacterium]